MKADEESRKLVSNLGGNLLKPLSDLDLALRKAAPEQPKSEQKIEKKGIELLEKAGISSEKEQKVVDAMEPVFQAGALINPVIGIPNDIKTIMTGSDIYNNKATKSDVGLSSVSVVSFALEKFGQGPLSVFSGCINLGVTIISTVNNYNSCKKRWTLKLYPTKVLQ